jgi:hypothetical protein
MDIRTLLILAFVALIGFHSYLNTTDPKRDAIARQVLTGLLKGATLEVHEKAIA